MASTPTASPISLVIPAYNRDSLIDATLQSALAQSHAFAAIIVVDDGSTDNTAALLNGYGSRLLNIRTPNRGVQMARNTGVAAATTELVALCDSDDLLEPEFAAKASAWMNAHPEIDIFFSNFVTFDQHGVHADKFSRGPADFFNGGIDRHGVWINVPDLYARTIRYQPFFPTGTVFRKSFFERIGGFDPAFRGVGAEDWEFSLRAIAQGRAAACTAVLARIRKHDGNDSRDAVRMNLGEALILEHGLARHPGVKSYAQELRASVELRRLRAFEGAFAQGDFDLANRTRAQLRSTPSSMKFLLRRWICELSPPWRQRAWALTQGRGATPPAPAKPALRITVFEPTWDGLAHLPGNLGLLRIVHQAYPGAQLSFVGGAEQIDRMRELAPPELLTQVHFVVWVPHYDKDALPTDAWAAYRRLRRLPHHLTTEADLLVFCSCTATALTAVTAMGLASRSCAVLHGNAGELAGWRSHNPLRRALDLGSALPRFCRQGGKAIVIEERIRRTMGQQYPWLAPHLLCIPHPLLPEEANATPPEKPLMQQIRIGFAGMASIAKGFPEYLQFATELARRCPGKFHFSAIGYLPGECKELDQSALSVPAGDGLQRPDFVRALNHLHYIFVWHKDEYYGNAASGVVYDAVNLGVPMIARRRAQIADWEQQGIDVALSFDDVGESVDAMAAFDPQEQAERYHQQCQALGQLRGSLSLPNLGRLLAASVPLSVAQARH